MALSRIKSPTIALLGAMALVGLLTSQTKEDPSDAPVDVIGACLSDWVGEAYIAFVAPLAALGAFFSGSTTVSNLTFAGIHQGVAQNLNWRVAPVLALQCAAAASGNMICLANIIAAKTVVKSDISEGAFIRVTGPICALQLVIITLVSLGFLFQ